MDADKSRPVRRSLAAGGARPQPVRRPRKLALPDLPSGSQRDVRDLLYGLHEKAGRPSLEALEKRIADDDRLDGAPKKDLIHKIISRGGPARLDDVRAVARVLARDCGHDEFSIAAQVAQLLDLAEDARTASRLPALTASGDVPLAPGRPIGECDPLALEVHRAINVPGTGDQMPLLPAYVDRAHDRRMREIADCALAGSSQMITLVGGSSTGKTRACWELAKYIEQQQPGEWRIWHPYDPTRPEAAADEVGQVGPKTIVWLNEAQLYLAPLSQRLGERIAAGLRTLLAESGRGPVLVLATMWPGHWTKLTNRPMDEGLADPHGQARELLNASDIDIPEAFTPSDLTDLDTKGDPRLHQASTQATGGRITQYLAGAPLLFDRYRKAPPAARALLDVAIDAHRLGHLPTIPHALLELAAAGYLDDEAWNLNDEDWLEQALAYTAQPCNGTRGLLTPLRPRPGENALSGDPVYRLADYVEQAGATLRANVYPPPSFWHAASCTIRDASALRALGWAAEQRGRYQHAAVLYRASIKNGELASFKALLRLIDHTDGTSSNTVVNLCRSAADLGSTDAINHLAFMQERSGDLSSAAKLYRQAADLGDMDARQALARLSNLTGDARSATATANSDTEAGRTIAQRGERAGDLDRIAFRYPEANGQQDRDARLRQQNIERAHTNALIELAHTRHQAGDFRGAVSAARQAAERGQTGVLSQLALYLDQQGDSGGAVRLAHEAADRGNPIVLSRLARRRELAGDPDAAAGLYREAVNRANINAMINLARLREQAGDTDNALRIQRFGLDAHGSPAEPWTA